MGSAASRDVTYLVITARQQTDARVVEFGYYIRGVCLRTAGRRTNPGFNCVPKAQKLTEWLDVDAAGRQL